MPIPCKKCNCGTIRKCVRCGHVFCGNCESGASCPLCGDNSHSV